MKASERSAQISSLEKRVAAQEKVSEFLTNSLREVFAKANDTADTVEQREGLADRVAGLETETRVAAKWFAGLDARLSALESSPAQQPTEGNGTCWWAWAVAMLGAGVAALAAYEHRRQQHRRQQPLRRVQEGLAP